MGSRRKRVFNAVTKLMRDAGKKVSMRFFLYLYDELDDEYSDAADLVEAIVERMLGDK